MNKQTCKPRPVAAYDEFGNFAGTRNPHQVKMLVAQGIYAPELNRKGVIVALHRPGSIRATAHMGQAYVINEHLPSGHRAFKHKPLPKNETSSDLFVRSIFRAVPLSVMQVNA